jgi:hypothetical protein
MRRYALRVVLIMGATFFLCSCSLTSVKRAKFLYGSDEATVITPITCSSIEYNLVEAKRKDVKNKAFLNALETEMRKLEPYEKTDLPLDVDIRIKLIVDYKNETSDILCLGGFYGTILNGNLMEDNPKLLDLIKSKIY